MPASAERCLRRQVVHIHMKAAMELMFNAKARHGNHLLLTILKRHHPEAAADLQQFAGAQQKVGP